MDYEHPFVAEIRAHPHDDEPRLIYADYLDEAGDPQGELIRVQVAIARLPPGDPARRELELREEDLLAAHADDWLAPLRALGAEGVSSRSFQRGLIERVQISAEAFLKSGQELCRQAPALHCLELRGLGEQLRQLVGRPLPAQITELDLRSNALTSAETGVLSWAVWVDQLLGLSLALNRLDDEAIRALVRVTWPRLARLNLSVNRLGPESMSVLANHRPSLPLTALALSVNKTGDMGLQLLAHSPLAATLRELDVGSTGVTAAGLLRLAASPLLGTLERLVLRGNPLGEGSERALATLAAAPRLKHLDLRGTHRVMPRSGYGSETREPPPELRERLGEGLLW